MSDIVLSIILTIVILFLIIVVIVCVFTIIGKKHTGKMHQRAFEDSFEDPNVDNGDTSYEHKTIISKNRVIPENNDINQNFDVNRKPIGHYIIILLIIVAFLFLMISDIIDVVNTIEALQLLNLDISATVYKFIAKLLAEIAFCAFAIFTICKVKDINK